MVLSSLPGAPNQGWAPQFSSAQTQPCCTPSWLCCTPAPVLVLLLLPSLLAVAAPQLSPVSPSRMWQIWGHIFGRWSPQRHREDLELFMSQGLLGSNQSLLSPRRPQMRSHAHYEQLGERWGEQEGEASPVSFCPQSPVMCLHLQEALQWPRCPDVAKPLPGTCTGSAAPTHISAALGPMAGHQEMPGHKERDKRGGEDTSGWERVGGSAGTLLGHVGTVGELPAPRVAKGTRYPTAFPQIEQFTLDCHTPQGHAGAGNAGWCPGCGFCPPKKGTVAGYPCPQSPGGSNGSVLLLPQELHSQSQVPVPVHIPAELMGRGWRKGMFLGTSISGHQQAPLCPDTHITVYFPGDFHMSAKGVAQCPRSVHVLSAWQPGRGEVTVPCSLPTPWGRSWTHSHRAQN